MDHLYLKLTSEISFQYPDTVVVQVSGKLGLADVGRFRAEIERLFGCGCRHIELDLNELLYIDSGGLASLIPLYQWVREKNGTLRILNPRRIIQHILNCARVNDIIDIDYAP
jgi:anti-anti-sigma factor